MWTVLILTLFLGNASRAANSYNAPPPLWPVHVESMDYPLLAAGASVQGTIVVQCEIDRSGAVMQAKAYDGDRYLVTESEANARRWRFFVPEHFNPPLVAYLKYEYRLNLDSRNYDPKSIYAVDLPYHIVISAQKPPQHVLIWK